MLIFALLICTFQVSAAPKTGQTVLERHPVVHAAEVSSDNVAFYNPRHNLGSMLASVCPECGGEPLNGI